MTTGENIQSLVYECQYIARRAEYPLFAITCNLEISHASTPEFEGISYAE